MNGNVRRRVSARVLWTLILAAALALIPPVLYHDAVYGKFFLEDTAKDMANQFLSGMQWIHLGAIVLIWLVNQVFFSINQSKNDSGSVLRARVTLQGFFNFILILLSVGAMIGYRYAISSDMWVGELFGTAARIKAVVWMPYYVVAICGWVLWQFCMKAAPATSIPVTMPIAKWFDKKMLLAERTR